MLKLENYLQMFEIKIIVKSIFWLYSSVMIKYNSSSIVFYYIFHNNRTT